MTKKAKVSKAKKPMKRVRRQKPARQLATPVKSYRFSFKPVAQVLASNAVAGTLTLAGGAGGFQAPLTATNFQLYASTNGLPNYYDIALAVPFKLADINAVGAFTSMFDSYKFGKVSCRVEYLNNVSPANGTGLMPTLYHYWDNDDAIIPPSLTSITSKQGVSVRQFGNKSRTSYTCSGIPTIIEGLSTVGAGIALAGIRKPTWINSVNTTVQHNALKIMITDVYLPGGASITQAFRFHWAYSVSFRDPLNTA